MENYRHGKKPLTQHIHKAYKTTESISKCKEEEVIKKNVTVPVIHRNSKNNTSNCIIIMKMNEKRDRQNKTTTKTFCFICPNIE